MNKGSQSLFYKLSLGIFLGVLFSPVAILFLFQEKGAELDADLAQLAYSNTLFLGLSVLAISSILGLF